MVPRVEGPIPRRSDSTVPRRSRPTDTNVWTGDGVTENVTADRVETLQAILRAKGHSREATNMMSRCHQESSQQVYESHWSRFVVFCRTKRWQVFQVRAFRLERLVQCRIMPKWDLHLVLLLLRLPFISQVEVHGKSSDDVIPLK